MRHFCCAVWWLVDVCGYFSAWISAFLLSCLFACGRAHTRDEQGHRTPRIYTPPYTHTRTHTHTHTHTPAHTTQPHMRTSVRISAPSSTPPSPRDAESAGWSSPYLVMFDVVHGILHVQGVAVGLGLGLADQERSDLVCVRVCVWGGGVGACV